MFIRNFWYLKIQRCVVYLFACQFWESQSRTFKTFLVLAEELCVRPEGKKTLPQSLQGPNVVGLCVGPWHCKINKHTGLPTFLKTRRWSRWKRGATAGQSRSKHQANPNPRHRGETDNLVSTGAHSSSGDFRVATTTTKFWTKSTSAPQG